MSPRAYDNSGREKKRQETRDRIVRVMVEAMAAGGDDVSVAEVAEESGVSLRTVYQHFPDKQARVHAIDEWIDSQVDMTAIFCRGYDDIPDYIERLVDYILENETLIRAQMAPGLSKDVRSYRKRAHARHLRKALRERIPNDGDVEDLTALILTTIRADTVLDLRHLHGFTVHRIKERLRRWVELAVDDATP